ncbi:hypothetical protein BGZ83_004342 [Gryganskiella cystojenkinii]|nr:hypothetical protein BGZ83_004342 [Gryganskiella cystojenkinii]
METLRQTTGWIGPNEPQGKIAPQDTFFFPAWRPTITKIKTRVIPAGWMLSQLQNPSPALTYEVPTVSSTEELQASFRTIYSHLKEKHSIDRLVHGLYVRSDDRHSVDPEKESSREEALRIHFVSTTRVRFPRPTELQPALRMARVQNLTFLTTLLTNPGLRFRICVIAHLLESALGLANGVWCGEHPRVLDDDERTYVINKLQHVFGELFDDTIAKQELVQFLDDMRDWILTREVPTAPAPSPPTMSSRQQQFDRGHDREQDLERERKRRAGEIEEDDHSIPALVRDIFPACGSILREIFNIYGVSQTESTFKNTLLTFWMFIRLSLTERKFVRTADYANAAKELFNTLRLTLDNENFRGPSNRLMRTLVNTADQLWEGGEETDSCLAMERVFAYFIRRSIERDSGAVKGQRMGDNAGFSNHWDMMHDFQALIRSLTQNMAPVPMPGIAWKGKSSEMYLDSMVLEFPNFSQRNIHLNTTMTFDPISDKMVRYWHLKITGVEILAKHVQFFFTITSAFVGRIADVGEMNLRIPPGSLEIEISFTISPPSPRRTQESMAPTRFRSRFPESETMRPAAALHDLYSPKGSMRLPAEGRGLFSRGDHRYEPSPPGAPTGSPRNDPATGARIGQHPAHRNPNQGYYLHRSAAVGPEDRSPSSAFTILSQLLYPNRERSPSSSQAQETERILGGWVPATNSMRLGRSGRRLAYANRTNVREIYSDDPILTSVFFSSTTDNKGGHDGHRSRSRSQYHAGPKSTLEECRDCVALKVCRVEVRKLNMDILKTKNPLLHAMTRGILVRHLRQSIEETILETIVDVIDTVNAGVEHVSSFTDDDFQKRHGLPPLPVGHRRAWYANGGGGNGNGGGNGADLSGIYAAMPLT